MQIATQSSVELPDIKKLRSGKVREVFDLGETLLFVATDRISAFDVILPDPIPYKGAVLNQISAFWFKRFDDIRNHFVTANVRRVPEGIAAVPRAARRAFDDRKENQAACRWNAWCAVIWLVPVGKNIRNRRAFAGLSCRRD